MTYLAIMYFIFLGCIVGTVCSVALIAMAVSIIKDIWQDW